MCIIGCQHYLVVNKKWMEPELQYERDMFKVECANKNGYTVIHILQESVWHNRGAWEEKLKRYLKEYDSPTCFTLVTGRPSRLKMPSCSVEEVCT